ncbi:MAG: galactose mutarotase [Lachnospiraceae bacterium]|nr:galactose mutarotase [Lachnospiraceae bacterium]
MITESIFGKTKDGVEVKEYTITNANGMSFSAITFGAVIRKVMLEDKKGVLRDVVLGYDSVENYEKDDTYLGAVVGRYANRIGNATFELNGEVYKLEGNDNGNHLHGGYNGYDKRVWDAETFEGELGNGVTFKLFSPDLDQKYPGNLEISVTYTLTDDNDLMIDYRAVSDKDTICNLTNHSYFNLGGHDSGSALNQYAMINADFVTEADAKSITTGKMIYVSGTPMDFTSEMLIGDHIDDDYYQLNYGLGYDHNWALNKKEEGEMILAATLENRKTGIKMEVYTDLPGVQFYSGNFLKGELPGKDGVRYLKRYGVCFETQYYPDSINKPEFPSPILKAGEEYKTTTIYKFV